jgi:hypothetical protein
VCSLALDKATNLQKWGRQQCEASVKLYKKQMKAQVKQTIQRYKEICRRQWKGADSRVFKYQLNEFD